MLDSALTAKCIIQYWLKTVIDWFNYYDRAKHLKNAWNYTSHILIDIKFECFN